MFCEYFQINPIPTTVQVLCFYAQFLSRSFKSVNSIKNYLSGVKLLHLYLDDDYPKFDEFQLKLTLKGLARMNPHCPKQALHITPQILLRIFELLDISKPYDATFWCLFLHAFFLMFRKSNLVPNSVKQFDERKQLCRKNIKYDRSKGMLIFDICWSKTIQCGERTLYIPLVEIPNSSLCPVKAYINMITLIPAENESPAFCILKGKLLVPVTYYLFQNVLRKLIKEIGEDPKQYSSHSFRRGGATWAFSSNIPSELIQLYGDWSSDAYKTYLKFSLKDKISVAIKMKDHILDI